MSERTLIELAGAGQLTLGLVHGDLLLAEPAAARIAEAAARHAGCPVATWRRPPALAPLLQDLLTFSLFGTGKVVLVVDSALFADRRAAADLVDDAAEVLPHPAGRAFTARERQAACRLLQAFHLFGLDPQAGTPDQALARLPAWALEGGRELRGGRGGRGRGKRQVEELAQQLAGLLEAARGEGLLGFWDSDLSLVASLLHDGLPPGHALVFAERTAALDHPLVEQLASRSLVLAAGSVEAEKGSWQGLEMLAAELARETGVEIAADALNELARRTLRQDGRGSGRGGADADSMARLGAEYRKLAGLARAYGAVSPGAAGKIDRIERGLVEQVVEDRGEEDVWQVLDAIATGRGAEALSRLRRLLLAADDPVAGRLGFFSLLASFCRQLVAIRGLMRTLRVPPGEENYGRFKSRHAPALQAELPAGRNPVAGIHPFRLHRSYLAASRCPEAVLARLPAELLETELQLKGESGEASTALVRLVVHLAGHLAGSPRPAPHV